MGAPSHSMTASITASTPPPATSRSSATVAPNRTFEPTGTPGIPLDRVPYFTHDLRQVAIVGGLMIVLLVIANYTVIPLLTR